VVRLILLPLPKRDLISLQLSCNALRDLLNTEKLQSVWHYKHLEDFQLRFSELRLVRFLFFF
jgi:hypothetical protein